ncbi:VIT family protein [Methyloligella sp. 2.7D]|uniref:VIT1/CCC1 transporter family protein n=1 Tax=unclassified Methyloligella TaxID=2625955 RepID=UPI00157E0681|nr:VIT family protein [Methyloligella sp. GL2]QKP76050.1 VIT family protein [Methyloligella sp. GL2]
MAEGKTDPHAEGRQILKTHAETHVVSRIGWLRAAVLGANDGIISTSSLILGVAGASADKQQILLAGVAALVAGAMSMAAGEYVSVSSQSDTEQADLARERSELDADPELETEELAEIYVGRGVEPALAHKVAKQLMEKDALEAHARDELGISEITAAKPIQAAFTSLGTFAAGAIAPLLVVILSPETYLVPAVAVCTIAALALLGFLGASAGGAKIWRSVSRVTFWGALAMAVTYGIGALVGTSV